MATIESPPDAGVAITSTTITLPSDQKLSGRRPIALSPDGRELVYTASTVDQPQLYLRPLENFEAQIIEGTEGAENPFFSPDGQSIGFFAQGQLKTMSLTGELPKPIVAAPSSWGATWGDDGWIIFTPTFNRGLWRVSDEGEGLEQLTVPDFADAGFAHVFPQHLPDGNHVLFSLWGDSPSAAVLSLDTTEWERIIPGTQSSYLPTGHVLVNAMDDQVSAVPFDLSSLSVLGGRVGVLTDVFEFPGTGHQLATSISGTLAFIPWPPPEQIVLVNRQGRAERLSTADGDYATLRLSPDGERLAVIMNPIGTMQVIDVESGTPTPVPPPGIGFFHPLWLDTRNLAFASSHDGSWSIYSVDVDSDMEVRELLLKEFDQFPESLSPDGSTLVYREIDPANSDDLWTLSLEDDQRNPLVISPGNDRFAAFSPEGGWIAYSSDESGRDQVHICSFSNCSGDRRTVDYGTEPRWSPDGRELYFRKGNQMWAVDIPDPTTMALGDLNHLFDGPQYKTTLPYWGSYEVHPDGDRFLMITDTSADEIRIVQNWFEELKRLVPTP